MGQVSVTVNGTSYDLVCGDGEEQRLVQLARYVDGKIAAIASTVGQVGEGRLLLMAALVITDEMWDAAAELRALRGAARPGQQSAEARDQDQALGADIEALAERIESIAARLTAT
ncbi:MAG: cell division protein ZapA [Rhodospirillales bacterium]|nr:MAG: cell division protein ZapA [Rhodospirillales bacterium]